jgi:hypothetical protein
MLITPLVDPVKVWLAEFTFPDTESDVPDATPILGVVKVGEVCNTRAPEPVELDTVIAKVPELVIGDPVTERNEGTVNATEVTVPFVGVLHVIGFDPPPPDVKTWPEEPDVIGRLKLYVPAIAWGKILITPLVLPVKVCDVEFTTPLTESEVPDATPILGVVNEGEVCSTNAPEPVELETEIAKVPELVIGDPETDKNDGTDNATDVTVPVVGVVQVIAADPPPPEVNTWPEVPDEIGKLKL